MDLLCFPSLCCHLLDLWVLEISSITETTCPVSQPRQIEEPFSILPLQRYCMEGERSLAELLASRSALSELAEQEEVAQEAPGGG